MRRKVLAECLFIGLFVVGSGCRAPHDNPLDPASSGYRGPAPTPAVLDGRIRSVHISRIFPTTDSYSVIAELDGRDAADQDSAWVAFDGGPRVALVRIAPTVWATIFSASYFQTPDYPHLGTVIGRPFLFTSRDDEGAAHVTGPAYMWRVIEDVPVLTSPALDDTVGANPTFAWQAFAAEFRFGYEASVINLTQGFETTVWTSPLLGDTLLSIQYPDSLPNGDYYWTITVEDSFDNSSRSKEGTFTVVDTVHAAPD